MAGDTYSGSTAEQRGEQNVQNNFFNSLPRASWPHQVGVLPPRAACFQDRAEVARLRQVLAGGGTAVVAPTAERPAGGVQPGGVLAGLGGVGKTQLAADYARSALSAGEVDVLLWVTAVTRGAVVDVYSRAAAALLGVDAEDPEAAAGEFLAWLEPKSGAAPCRWLVVLDDVADPAALRGLWPPPSPYGRTLATTRRQDAALTGTGRHRIEVGVFTPAEAAHYLTAALADHDRTEPPDDITGLAADLGCLPLALSQAAAYLVDAGKTCAAYRTLLADRARTLAELSPDVLPDDQHHTTAAAWSLSVEHADRLRPAGLARPMLHLAAFLDPNGIPASVLTSPPALDYLATHRTDTSTSTQDEVALTADDADGALRALHRLSLLQQVASTGTSGEPAGLVRVHQLVQRATRDTLTRTEHDQAARAAADALISAWPNPERDTAYAQALRANTTALTACAETALHQPDAHLVLFRVGRSLGESGQLTAAVNHYQHLAATTRRHLGPDHPDTLTTRNNLARWQGRAGDATGAAAALAELLTDMLRVLGPDHPDTLTTRSNLASWRGGAGDAAGAAVAFAELLTAQVRVLGPDHPDTLTTRSNLARWRGRAGDAAGTAAALADLLTDRLRVLGPDHPDTLTARSNLAHWQGEAGDATGAAVATAELLTDMVRVLGPDHPDTLTTRNNLARWQGEAGDATGAAVATAELLTDMLRVLGPDHPDTLTARNNLASWRGRAGDAAGAAVAFAELLTEQVRVLGPDHPDTLTTRNNLASWQGEAGDAAGAAVAFAELLTDMVRVLGPDHPDTLTTRNNLASWRGRAGDAAGAAAAFAELLTEQVRVLGPDHPGTLITRNNLAHWRGRAGDAAGAAVAFAELLTEQVRVLGPDHPRTLTTRSNLASWRGRAGDAAGAAAAFAELLTDMVRVLGPDHPDTLTTRNNLAHWQERRGKDPGTSG